MRVGALSDLGLGHLPLARPARALASGELRRLWLAGRTAAELTGVLYVVDEPAAGLADPGPVAAHLRALVAAGNGVLVVTHRRELISAAERVIALGPGPGHRGGRVLYAGAPEGLADSETPTGRWLSGLVQAPEALEVAHDLPELRLTAPGATELKARYGALTAVTGPSGAGKSALVIGTLTPAALRRLGRASEGAPHAQLDGPLERVVALTRSAATRTPRSCVATALKIWAPIRRLLAATREARIRGVGPEFFSFNRTGGRCPECEGSGVEHLDLGPRERLTRPCPSCDGERFGPAALSIRYRGLNAAELLGLEVEIAAGLLAAHRRVGGPLRAMVAVGLGYLPLGQPTASLSGGESQRLRLAGELARIEGRTRATHTLVCLDAPLAGLHRADAARIAGVLQRLARAGAAVVCASADPWMVAAASHVARLGATTRE